jgi:SAM-dependent methyltransferase
MSLPPVLRQLLNPAIAPLRAAVNRRVEAMLDRRLAVLLSDRIPPTAPALSAPSLALLDDGQHPNHDPLWIRLRDLEHTRLSIKFFGYELARTLAAALPQRTELTARHVGLHSKASTQADIESDWCAYWLSELKVPVLFHRKLWEFAYALQAIHESGCLRPGSRGLGFGCGEEPLPSYFAARGVDVLVTDLAPTEAAARGWVDTGQHTSSLERAYRAQLVNRADFDRHVSLRHVDMNAIPPDLRDFDFCWSICALEHLGSLQKGLDFIENALATLRPGGVAVHTTEFNYLNDEQTIDHWVTVLYQKRHFRDLAEHLRGLGHEVAPLDFDVGDKPLDMFIDLPPYHHEWTDYQREVWRIPVQHLKVSFDGFACTCFGIIVRKR